MLKLAFWFSVWSVLALAPAAQAQSAPSVDEKLSYIFEVSEVYKGLDVGYAAMKAGVLKKIQGSSSKVTPEVTSHIADIIDAEFAQLKPSMLAFIKDYYKRSLTEEEIGALYDLYQTPVGSRLASKLNAVSAGLVPEMQTFMGSQFAPRIGARLDSDPKLLEDLRR